MKHLYPTFSYIGLTLLLTISCLYASSQMCPDGSLQGQVAYDRTITVGGGITNTVIRFPKFDPANGMVTCMNLCVTMTGVINKVQGENDEDGNAIVNVIYTRLDQLTGPGIGTIANYVNTDVYGDIPLGPDDNSDFGGADWFQHLNDTVLAPTTICRQLSDSTALSAFYGPPGDSLSYNYQIAGNIAVFGTLNMKNVAWSTKAIANIKMTYCTCPAIVLPINVYSFEVTKMLTNKAKLQWDGYDDPGANYHYEPQVSTDGRNFTTFSTNEKNQYGSAPYTNAYTAASGSGVYYFRIKQVYSNGYSRYSNVRQVLLENPAGPKFSVFPNPSTGIVGIKFDNSSGGQYSLRIFSANGQTVVNKEIVASSSSYQQIATLETGVYWIRVTDKTTQESNVSQILIK